jgi:acetate kinase
MGVNIDEEKIMTRGEEVTVSTPDSKVTVMVVPTNEELAIARQTLAIL